MPPRVSKIGFLNGFLSGWLLFILINLYSYHHMVNTPVLIDASVEFGLPFKTYSSGGFLGALILWNGLIADILITFGLSVILGLAFGFQKSHFVRTRRTEN